MENTKNKKVPYSISKKNFFVLCYPVPENTVKRRINEIIFENRSKNYKECKDLPRHKIVNCRYVEKVEIVEYFQTFGLPDGLEF